MSKLIGSNLLNNILIIKILTDSINNINIDEIKNSITSEIQKNIFDNIIIDLSMLKYIDSMGIGGFIAIKKQCAGASFFCVVSPAISFIFKITKMDSFLNVENSINEIISKINEGK